MPRRPHCRRVRQRAGPRRTCQSTSRPGPVHPSLFRPYETVGVVGRVRGRGGVPEGSLPAHADTVPSTVPPSSLCLGVRVGSWSPTRSTWDPHEMVPRDGRRPGPGASTTTREKRRGKLPTVGLRGTPGGKKGFRGDWGWTRPLSGPRTPTRTSLGVQDPSIHPARGTRQSLSRPSSCEGRPTSGALRADGVHSPNPAEGTRFSPRDGVGTDTGPPSSGQSAWRGSGVDSSPRGPEMQDRRVPRRTLNHVGPSTPTLVGTGTKRGGGGVQESPPLRAPLPQKVCRPFTHRSTPSRLRGGCPRPSLPTSPGVGPSPSHDLWSGSTSASRPSRPTLPGQARRRPNLLFSCLPSRAGPSRSFPRAEATESGAVGTGGPVGGPRDRAHPAADSPRSRDYLFATAGERARGAATVGSAAPPLGPLDRRRHVGAPSDARCPRPPRPAGTEPACGRGVRREAGDGGPKGRRGGARGSRLGQGRVLRPLTRGPPPPPARPPPPRPKPGPRRGREGGARASLQRRGGPRASGPRARGRRRRLKPSTLAAAPLRPPPPPTPSATASSLAPGPSRPRAAARSQRGCPRRRVGVSGSRRRPRLSAGRAPPLPALQTRDVRRSV